jgi:hypothetical protein
MIISLTTEQKQAVSKAVSNVTNAEHSDMTVFIDAWNFYKGVDKKQYGAVTKILKDEVSKSTKSKNIKTYFTKIFKTAQQWRELGVIMKFDKLEYTNVSHIVKLLVFLSKSDEFKKELTPTLEAFKAVWVDGMGEFSYNNKVADLVTNFKQTYKVVDVDGEYRTLETKMKSMVGKLSREQLTHLLDMVSDQLDKVEEVELQGEAA